METSNPARSLSLYFDFIIRNEWLCGKRKVDLAGKVAVQIPPKFSWILTRNFQLLQNYVQTSRHIFHLKFNFMEERIMMICNCSTFIWRLFSEMFFGFAQVESLIFQP
jgi:hypothetical protein